MTKTRTILSLVALAVLALAGFLYFRPAPAPTAGTAEPEAKVAAEAPASPAQSAETEIQEPTAAEAGTSAKSEGGAGQAGAPGEQIATLTTTDPAAASSQAEAQPQPADAPYPPSFDIVRVEPSGETVIAGRGMPGSEITVFAGDVSVGTVTADARGQWVLVLTMPLSPGSHELSLRSKNAAGAVLLSQDVAVVSVPRRQVAAAPAGAAAAKSAPSPSQPAASAGQAVQPVGAVQTATAPVAGLDQLKTAAPAVVPADQPLAVLVPRSGQGASRVLQQSETVIEGLAEGSLVLETVDYDDTGAAAIGGRAEPGARLAIYLDDALLGQTVAGADGRWALVLERKVPPGLHRLRVDQLGAQGQVVARVETPFSRATMVASRPDETSVVVQPGNSLWRISRRIYGEGTRYTVIYQANGNEIRDPDLIYPGQIFVLPAIN